jgi:hypothetical protein
MYAVVLNFVYKDCGKHVWGDAHESCSGRCYQGTFGSFNGYVAAKKWADSKKGQKSPNDSDISIGSVEVRMLEAPENVWASVNE